MLGHLDSCFRLRALPWEVVEPFGHGAQLWPSWNDKVQSDERSCLQTQDGAWRDVSVVKRAHCSCRGLQLQGMEVLFRTQNCTHAPNVPTVLPRSEHHSNPLSTAQLFTLHTTTKCRWVQRDHRTQNTCCGNASSENPKKSRTWALTIMPVPRPARGINPTILSRLTEHSPPHTQRTHSWENCSCTNVWATSRQNGDYSSPTKSPLFFSLLFKRNNFHKSLDFRKKENKTEMKSPFPAEKQLYYCASAPAQTYSLLLL